MPPLSRSPRLASWLVVVMLAMVILPAALTLHTVRITAVDPAAAHDPTSSPHGYTVSLLLFLVPIAIIALWLIPQEHLEISQRSFWRTIALLFPMGAALDFFFARYFFTFPNPAATVGLNAPALGAPVPVEEYIFYLTGFLCILLLYLWLDEYWLHAYSIPGNAPERATFDRLFHLHPASLLLGALLIAGAILYRRYATEAPGFPGYFIFLALTAFLPSSVLLPSVRPMINWRAFSLTVFLIVLISLFWEVTLALPYGWWGFRDQQMLGVRITAWANLPIEEVCLWIAVTYATVIVYEAVKRWQASERTLRHALFGA